MNTDKILEVLKTKFGLCPSGVEIFNNSKNDIEALARACKKWVELFIEHEEAYKLLKVLSPEQLSLFNDYNIYVDQEFELTAKLGGDLLLLGNCKAQITFEKYAVAQVYVLNNSSLQLNGIGASQIYVDVYHKAKVNAHRIEGSKIKVNCFNSIENVTGNSTVELKQYKKGEIFNYKY